MKRFSYLILLALLVAGLVGPVIYAHRAHTGEPAAKNRTEEMTDSAESAQGTGETRSQTEGQSSATPGNRELREPQTTKPQEPQSQQLAAGQATASGNSVPSEAAVAVKVAVVGQDGRLLYGPAEVKITADNPWGCTALGALDATGLPYTISSRFSGFVDSVAGQRNRGQSGWMYSVNGTAPLVAASEKSVKQGDKVLWWYSQSMSQTPPSWDELEKQR
ncbi:MAG: DUF4430 domain-containing protein [Thermacetogeniaceae bacterium]